MRPVAVARTAVDEGPEVRDGAQELAGVLVTRRVEDLRRRAGLDDAATLHDDHAVGQVGDDPHVMSDQEDAGIDAVPQVAHEVEDLRLDRHVERRRRLVGDEDPRIERQRLSDHRPLPLPARQLVGVGVDAALRLGDLDHLEQLDHPLARRLRGHRPVAAQHLGDLESDGVHGIQRCHRLLEDDGDLPAGIDRRVRSSTPTSSSPSSLIDPATWEFLGSSPISDERRGRLART